MPLVNCGSRCILASVICAILVAFFGKATFIGMTYSFCPATKVGTTGLTNAGLGFTGGTGFGLASILGALFTDAMFAFNAVGLLPMRVG